MRVAVAIVLIAAFAGSSLLDLGAEALGAEALRAKAAQSAKAAAQTAKPPATTTKKPAPRPATRKPAPKLLPPVTEPAVFTCPTSLGQGVRTDVMFCDVQIGRDPMAGIVIPFPPHQGPVTLSFDLHNRHTYSEEQIKANRAYHRYTATIGVLALDNTLLSRFYVQNEFRGPVDLVDRIKGGSGLGGLKAVAPTGSEHIVLVVDPEENGVSILGDKLAVVRVDGSDNFTAPGRPIAVISNVMLEYSPAPPPKPAPPRRK
jgi:hypothetical protein